jgi:glycosyltransferase involved in cell wall biosynthesis
MDVRPFQVIEDRAAMRSVRPADTIIFLCTEDWYFWSHRMPVARAARDAGLRVIVATRVQSHGQRILAEGFDLRPLAWRRKGDGLIGGLRALYAIVRLYREERPDLVHHIALKAVVFGSIAARFAGVPRQINAIAGLGFIFVEPSLATWAMKTILLLTLKLFVCQAGSRVLTQNPDDADELVKRGIAPRDRISIIRGSGVDATRFRPLPEPSGQVVIAMVSRMLRYKGVEILAEAAQLLQQRNVDARILVVGPLDPDSPASLLESEIRRLMKPGVIEWVGPTEDVLSVWKAAHIAVFPSQYREGVPLALLEAAACARPIVSTNTPGCREVVEDGVNGILVPRSDSCALAEALERLVLDKELRVRMGREGRLRVERFFTKELIVRQTLDLYGDALGRKL